MYCQQCGVEIGEARFCRRCGTPSGTQALAVSPPEVAPPNYEKGFKKFFMGLAFLIIAIFPLFSRGVFWWWMLFPAVPLLAAGLGEFMRARYVSQSRPPRLATLSANPQKMPAATPGELPRARNTAEIVPPTNVTEGTTRHLDKEHVQPD